MAVQETGLYYLQSRYYDPELGRFLNADAFTSTGQGLLGNNMFAYCNNNPANMIDTSGTIPFADHTFTEAAVAFGEMISARLQMAYNKRREEANKLVYRVNESGNGASISESPKINDPLIMYEYIEEHRGNEIAGSTAGIMFEWYAHNAAYGIGELLSTVNPSWGRELMQKGSTLDIGRTIYDDSHGGYSWAMWGTYVTFSPISAGYDLYVYIFE